MPKTISITIFYFVLHFQPATGTFVNDHLRDNVNIAILDNFLNIKDRNMKPCGKCFIFKELSNKYQQPICQMKINICIFLVSDVKKAKTIPYSGR